MAQTIEMTAPAMTETPCDCGQCEECYDRYFAMGDEFDALITALQASRLATRCAASASDNPFYCEYDLAKGWERAAALARLLVRQAEALRDECSKTANN